MRAHPKQRQLSAAQSKAIDLRAQRRFGMPVLLLMENAGSAVAKEAVAYLKDKKAGIAVFCGKGNNGGDGFCAARHLLAAGIRPQVFLAGKAREVKNEEARLNLRILLKLGCPVVEVNEKNFALLRRRLKMCACVIDALLGVGLTGAAGGIYKTLIETINASGAFVIAVDIPSGLDATTGRAPGACVRADKTVTFVARKRGMSLRSGPALCGKVIVAKLGIDL
ncbi:MAG: NAD(P)H-hydrate epimerase [Candidatus Omnitrophica bacterium]|nr:NAD(P)H-hydrate epimerase [Candidatus Omnitrophota bacterium]